MSYRLLLAFIALAITTVGLSATPTDRVTAAQSPSTGAPPAAIVARLRGTAVVEGGASARPLRLFDRLESGAILRTTAGAEVVVVFRAGARVRIGASSRARLEDAGAVALAGTVDRLSAVPTVPIVAPVAGAGSTITAVRIRSGALKVMGPRHGSATLAPATVLEYEPVAGSRYEIEIQEAGGPLVFRAEVSTPRFTVPDTVLRPGVAYEWRVTARLATGFTSSGEGRFRTLGAEAARAREDLRAALAGEPDAASLLAEVDRSLGLWREALEGFRAARAAGAEDLVIGERIADLERRLAGDAEPRDDRD